MNNIAQSNIITLQDNEKTQHEFVTLCLNTTNLKMQKDDYISSFNSFAAKAAQTTLEMCRVVQEAKVDLDKNNFESFCQAIGHRSNDSTIRKYLAIGARYSELHAVADRLPNSWTSIYLITMIPPEKLLTMIDDVNSFKNMTAQKIKQLISTDNASSEKTVNNSLLENAAVSIYFEKSPSIIEWNTLKMQLKAISGFDSLKIRIEFSNKFEKIHEHSKNNNRDAAKRTREIKAETKKNVDEKNYVYNPAFDYGGAYDFDLGEFIS